MQLLNLHAPAGTAWQLFVVVVVIIAAPVIVERVRIPGLIGLLAGGCIIGPQVLGIVSDTTGVLHELGEVGLLYLMFLAGLELDLNVFARYRNRAIGFMALTYSAPQILGTIGGLIVGYSVAGSVLLGSLFASFTLVAYPIVRNMGLAGNPAVAATVGATVLTDTLALVVLAFISGSTTGDANGVELIVQVVLGLAILVGFAFGILPPVARWFFRGIGQPRTLRYVFMLAALLSAAVVAEVVGIEGIVGAFFCGLALNRMVPNEGEFMERIEFFGSSLLIPTFLVSIGTVIDPAVLVDPGTLGLAGVFVVACVGGKLLAAALCRPLFGYTQAEFGVVFGLSVAQAAATLAATFVGLQIGLFTSSTVNAVMIVVVVTLILASVFATRFGAQMPKPAVDTTRIGRMVIAHVGVDDNAGVIAVAAAIAGADVGVVRPTFVVADGEDGPSEDLEQQVDREITRLALDAELEVRHDRAVTDGLLHTAGSHHASLIVVPAMSQSWLPALLGAGQHGLVAASEAPVALVRSGTARPNRVVLALGSTQARRPSSAGLLAASMATRFDATGYELVVVAGDELRDDLVQILGRSVTPTIESPQGWVAERGQPTDIVLVPGGRNGAIGTARITKQAVLVGATVVAAADRESVTTNALAAEGLGLVTSRGAAAAPSDATGRENGRVDVAALVDDLRALGVCVGDVLMVHASLRALGPVDGGAAGVVDALDHAVGDTGTLLMTLGAHDTWAWVNERPEAQRAELLTGSEPFDALTAPADPDVGTLAEVFRLTAGTVVSDHPEGRFGARGRLGPAMVADPPWNDYYGPGSALERLVAAGGKVLRLGADADTVTLTHYAEYVVSLPHKRRVRRHRLVATPQGPHVVVVDCLDDSDGIVDHPGEDYFATILHSYLATGRARTGTVGNARSELVDAGDFVEFAADWMRRHLS